MLASGLARDSVRTSPSNSGRLATSGYALAEGALKVAEDWN
jgi:hypothetical protein